MRILVIGLGSMGKRRIRNLKLLNKKNISGFDLNKKRCADVNKQYNIPTYKNFNEALKSQKPNLLIISTPPDKHYSYAFKALKEKIDSFMEVSVENPKKVYNFYKKAINSKQIIIPSSTMIYHEMPKKIKKLINQNFIGKVLNINYQTGQYLPDWHSWEKIKDYYVSKKTTAACKEIIVFELIWLIDIFGFPKVISSYKDKISKLRTNINDIYHFVLKFPNNTTANITIEILSRPVPTRELVIIGSNGKIIYDNLTKTVKCINYKKNKKIFSWKIKPGKILKNYVNPEKPYIDEMKNFLLLIKKRKLKESRNSLINELKILNLLKKIEGNKKS